jgi:DnaJ-class molecular chaperone
MSDNATDGVYNPPDREGCDRCGGMGVIMQVGGPEYCPDCDGSGYAEGWPHDNERTDS